jgi:acetyl esterase
MIESPLPEDVRRFLTEVVPLYRFPVWSELDAVSGPAFLKRARVSVVVPPGPDVADVETDDRLIRPGLAVRVYRHRGQRDGAPVVVYLHGGGWVVGDLELNDGWCRWFVQKSGVPVVSVDYRLAPEHPFPAPLEDCLTATSWVAAHAVELGCDPDRVAVMGTSAGGNLAAAVALRAREAGLRLAAQVLVYPVLDSSCATPSYAEHARGYFLERDQMRWYWDQYTVDTAARESPLASPSRAQDLGGLPYTVLVTAELDPLRDEGADYARRLSEAGVRVDYRCFAGQLHGFVVNRAAFSEADVATAEIVDLLLTEFRAVAP